MKKVFLTISAFALLAVACGDDKGREVDATDAQEVVDNTTETTVEYSTVSESSKVEWFASHIGGIDPHNGHFAIKEGSVKVTDGKVTNGSFVVDMPTLHVDIESVSGEEDQAKLTGHLKSADFFEVEKYPTSKFEVTEVSNEVSEDKKWTSKVTGNFTMLDSTKSVTFWANITITDTDINVKSERFSIDRTKWGLNWGEEGLENAIISNAVGIEVDVTLTK